MIYRQHPYRKRPVDPVHENWKKKKKKRKRINNWKVIDLSHFGAGYIEEVKTKQVWEKKKKTKLISQFIYDCHFNFFSQIIVI